MAYHLLAALVAIALILGVLWDAFETIVLPRSVTRPVRLTRAFYRLTWATWTRLAGAMHGGRLDGHEPVSRREALLSYYGPIALLLLLGIWAIGLIVGFGLLQWSLGSALVTRPGGHLGFWTDVYMSGTTFFTLGIGDVTPRSGAAEVVTVFESGIGFAFLALVIGYLPILYQNFSRREMNISLLDARAGSPPSAVEMLRRNSQALQTDIVIQFLREWEAWCAQLLETHLSYPAVAYFRSQHENQSWLAALTTILDACALAIIGVDGMGPAARHQAQLSFAMARHAAVDLSQIFDMPPTPPDPDRLPPEDLARLREILAGAGVPLTPGIDADLRLAALRRLYEPYVHALAVHLLMPLPGWLPLPGAHDDWQTTAWDKATTKVLF